MLVTLLIQYKPQPHPNDGFQWNKRSRDDHQVKASFARFWHPDTRSLGPGLYEQNNLMEKEQGQHLTVACSC